MLTCTQIRNIVKIFFFNHICTNTQKLTFLKPLRFQLVISLEDFYQGTKDMIVYTDISHKCYIEIQTSFTYVDLHKHLHKSTLPQNITLYPYKLLFCRVFLCVWFNCLKPVYGKRTHTHIQHRANFTLCYTDRQRKRGRQQ